MRMLKTQLGLSKTCGPNGSLVAVGRFSGGRRVGFWWRSMDGGGWLIHHFNNKKEKTSSATRFLLLSFLLQVLELFEI